MEMESHEGGGENLARKLLGHSSIYAVANFGTRGISFLLVPLYAAYLPPSSFGVVTLAESIASIIAVFAGWAAPTALFRLYHDETTDDPQHHEDLIATLWRGVALTTLFVGGICFAFGEWALERFSQHISLSFYPFVAIALTTTLANNFNELMLKMYQTKGEAGHYASFVFVSTLLTLSLVILGVVALKLETLGLLGGRSLAALVMVVCATTLTFKHWWRLGRGRKGLLKAAMLFAFPLVPHQFNAFILNASDRFLLDWFRGAREVGIYSMATLFGLVMAMISTAILSAYGPVFYRTNANQGGATLEKLSNAVVLVLMVAAVIGILLAHDVIGILLPASYDGASTYVSVIIAGYFFHGLAGLFQLGLIQEKRSALLSLSTITASIGNIALNLWLIPDHGIMGATIATLVSFGFEALFVIVAVRGVFPMGISVRVLGGAIAAVLGALALASVEGTFSCRLIAYTPTVLLVLWVVFRYVYPILRGDE